MLHLNLKEFKLVQTARTVQSLALVVQCIQLKIGYSICWVEFKVFSPDIWQLVARWLFFCSMLGYRVISRSCSEIDPGLEAWNVLEDPKSQGDGTPHICEAGFSSEGEVAVGEDDRGDEGPHVQGEAHPRRDDLHPHRRHVGRDCFWKVLAFVIPFLLHF